MEPYYYPRLSKPAQAVYHAMKAGFSALQPAFSVPRLDGSVLTDLFFQLRLDCPEIFYVTGFSYRYAPGAENVELLPEYLFEKSKIRDQQKALTARVEKLTRPLQDGSVWDQERGIHDFICSNVRYDKLKKPYSHEIIGPLTNGVGVCEGIAKTVKILCDALGIWCMIAVSEANPERGVKYRHAWNILKLDGQYYHLDATFDNSLGENGVLRYDYFNLDDKRLFRDHQAPLYPLPACPDGKHTYYQLQKCSFTTAEEVCKRAQMPLRKGLPFVFHWRGGTLNRDILAELVRVLEESAQKRGRHAAISYNYPQAVLCVQFPKELPREELVAQEADEAERDE